MENISYRREYQGIRPSHRGRQQHVNYLQQFPTKKNHVWTASSGCICRETPRTNTTHFTFFICKTSLGNLGEWSLWTTIYKYQSDIVGGLPICPFTNKSPPRLLWAEHLVKSWIRIGWGMSCLELFFQWHGRHRWLSLQAKNAFRIPSTL